MQEQTSREQDGMCDAMVLEPHIAHVPLVGFACSMTSRTFTTHKYFRGEEIVEKSDIQT